MTDLSLSENIEDIRELLASYVLGDLTSSEVVKVNKLLEDYPELKEEVNSLQKTLALFPLALPEVELPKTLDEKILKIISDETNNIQSTIFKNKKKLNLSTIIATCGISLVFVIGIYNFYLQRQILILKTQLSSYQELIVQLNDQNNSLVFLKGTKLNPQAQGNLFVIPQSKIMFIALENLAPLPQDKIYRLWGVVNDKKVYCAEFQPDIQGNILVKMALDTDMLESKGAVITIEPLQKLNYPTGKTVMISSK